MWYIIQKYGVKITSENRHIQITESINNRNDSEEILIIDYFNEDGWFRIVLR